MSYFGDVSSVVVTDLGTSPTSSPSSTGVVSSNTLTTSQLGILQSGAYDYGIDTGVANTYQVSLSPGPTGLTAGMRLWFYVANSNTGASTLNLNSLGALPVQINSSALVGGELVATSKVEVILNQSATAWDVLASSAGTRNLPAAVNPSQPVILSQANSRYLLSGADGSTGSALILSASTTLTVANSGFYIFPTSGNMTFTLPSPAMGLKYRLYGSSSSQLTTITASVGSIFMPDYTSSASITLGAWTEYVDLIADGANWRAFRTGRTVVSNAVNANEAVALGQAEARYVLSSADGSGGNLISLAALPATLTVSQSGKRILPQVGGTITLPTSPPSGVNYVIESCGSGAVTVQCGGSNELQYPGTSGYDYSGTSYTLDAVWGQTISLTWANGGWRLSTEGRKYVQNAVRSQDAVPLGQANGMYSPRTIQIKGGSSGTLQASQILVLDAASINYSFPSNFSGSVASCLTASTGTVTLAVNAYSSGSNTPSQVGTVTFSGGNRVGSFATSSGLPVSISAGMSLAIIGPSTADATLAAIAITLSGSF